MAVARRREEFAKRERERRKEKTSRERAIVTGIKQSDFSSELSLRCFLFALSLFPCLLSRERNCLINYDGWKEKERERGKERRERRERGDPSCRAFKSALARSLARFYLLMHLSALET